MKKLSIIALFSAASTLFAAPMPEKAELLASNTVVAHYMGTIEQPCRHLTADCPDKCDHATKAARFRVLKNEAYQQLGKYGDEAIAPGSIMYVDVKKLTPGQDDAALFNFIDTIKVGDTVRLTQKHYYGQIGNAMLPFRPVTAIEKVEKPLPTPATPAAAPGDYSVAPIAR